MSFFDRLDPTHGADPDRFASASPNTHFGWIRTRLGLERTAMAWVRTSISLIGFGFTIVKFFEQISKMETTGHQMRPEAPRDLGLALIAAGILAMLISTYQYLRLKGYLYSEEFKSVAGVGARQAASPVMVISLLIIFIGLFAFGSVLFHF